jgi:quercetin 2,3-dioxygenase
LAKIICGKAGGKKGPVHDLAVEVEYLDIAIAPGKSLIHGVAHAHTALAYVYSGEGEFGENCAPAKEGQLVLFGKGGEIAVKSGRSGLKFLLVSAAPLREPIAWGGPIVMNTEKEIRLAFDELNNGTFIKGDVKAR